MKFFQALSIKRKLLLIIIGTSTFAIIAGLVSYSIFDVIQYKEEIKNNASFNAALVGEYCKAPLVFGYKSEVKEALTKLEAVPEVISACVYDKDGNPFATYFKNSTDTLTYQNLGAQQFSDNWKYLHITKEIYSNNELDGTISLRLTTSSIFSKVINNGAIILVLIVGLSLPIYLISSRLQNLISGPILELADATKKIAQAEEYTLSINTKRHDEIGALFRGFNDMVAQIKLRQAQVDSTTAELKELNEDLENRVKIRTNELQTAIEKLNKAKSELEEKNQELVKEIDSRKAVERALFESEQKLENILNYAPLLVYINDLHGRYLFVNKEFERLMNVKQKDIVGKTDLELFPEERAERNKLQNEKVIETNRAQIFENKSVKPDGEHYFIDILFPIIDSGNKIYATCGWSLDITDRKQTEKLLKEAKEKAESADKLKSAFLATMSHELRTPLNSIIGFTGILLKELAGPLNDEQKKQLGMAKGSAQHLLMLVNDVLDISKIEAGQLVVSIEKFDFIETLKNVADSIKPLADKKNLELKLNIPEEVLEIKSDERRLSQVILNVLNNAVKFTEEGFIKIDCSINTDQIIVDISDTGIGIKPEDMNKLFKPFSQIDTGLTRNHEGTGLGLAISKKLVEKLGGSISVESEEGKGSSFAITLNK